MHNFTEFSLSDCFGLLLSFKRPYICVSICLSTTVSTEEFEVVGLLMIFLSKRSGVRKLAMKGFEIWIGKVY